MTLLPDARRAYGYNDRLFCLTGDSLYTVTAAGDKTLLYTAGADKKLALVGISLTDVYFTETDNLTGEVEYLTVGQTRRQQHPLPCRNGEERSAFYGVGKRLFLLLSAPVGGQI